MSVQAAETFAAPRAEPRVGPGVSRGRRIEQLIGFYCMALGMFMAVLDIQIVASSLAEIQAGLNAAPDEIGWIQSSYLIAEVIAIPLSGFLSHLLSTRWLFVISSAGFTLASVLCAFAWDIESMIAFRALQGLLGGAMIPTMFATSYLIFAGSRGFASMVTALIVTLGPTLGPTIGGWITAELSWHWLFLINLAPGIIVTVGVALLMDIDDPDWSLMKGFDLPGMVSIALFLGSMQYVLEEGAKEDWFQSDHISIFAGVALVSGLYFFWRQFTYHQPIVQLRVFANRNYAFGSLTAFISGIGLYGSTFVVPLYAARVLDYNSYQIGTLMAVTGAFQMLSVPFAMIATRFIDVRLIMGVGLGLSAYAAWLQAGMTSQSGWGDLVVPQAARGFGFMLLGFTSNQIALGMLPPQDLKGGSGLFSLMRNLGGAIGLAVISTMLTERMAHHTLRLAENVRWGRDEATDLWEGLAVATADAYAGRLDADPAALKILHQLVQREAWSMAFADAMLFMTLCFLVMVACLPFVRPIVMAMAPVKSDH
ncbi:DHA2 family efflux MFS transporter permease subunit [Zavarzinia sp. CC-PAN008]|uniref:DHA2 family efflux MFS transporter permease subunit n=1 Tax=Zavarzinia sp. CC-PAN008 TaxID=3243332 RepID=UPI003F744226